MELCTIGLGAGTIAQTLFCLQEVDLLPRLMVGLLC